ncbi:Membrane protein insertase YidC [Aquisphaera giovannonii]|uniref:Membrane protein insertase YidC n=1 Tax=Aquisphaera giovannonii TaxID=406548 RepID=A0A5B9W0J1_9BACT|nr:membrane protein insertase YidC [Aquisphaera giovannonii]QEH34162.1 Membrane protein insertase YidC [Aquisphaera giovannonii]
MNDRKQIYVVLMVMILWMLLIQALGWGPRPQAKKPQTDPAKVAKDQGDAAPDAKAEAPGREEDRPKGAEEKKGPKAPEVAHVDPSELVLGSATDKAPDGYRLAVQLEQKGAGVESILSSRYDAEFEGRKNPHLPLQILRRDPIAPPSLSLTINEEGKAAEVAQPEVDDEASELAPPRITEDLLDSVLWEVVRDPEGHAVRVVRSQDPATKADIEGQEVVFRATAANGVGITKTYRLWQTMNGLEVELAFESPDRERAFSYNLFGPHGIPIEGEWYTGTFREVFFGTIRPSGNGEGSIKVETHTANDIVKAGDKPPKSTTLPLRFAGVENQYFAAFLAPYPAPTSDEGRIDKETKAVVLHRDAQAVQKSDVGIRMTSKTIRPGPNAPVVHTFRVYTGPKIDSALAPYNASILAAYRKSSFIPGASYVARYFITPTLSVTYDLTTAISRALGGSVGNWGVAIILMTLFVKLLMFPLGRRQALMAQRTQQLQPYLKAIQEKYKDDKEQQTRETLALYKKHGVNPVSGCLPALIQLPIFVGLWQALNSSVSLRHSPFLWISDLAAPDMLFRFPVEIPLLGSFLGRWFNLLPILVVGLMLVQTKLFSPPATTPEAKTQQTTMQFMMVFMAVMFYKVPAGLGIYFITSSLWSIGERLLLPKITHAAENTPEADALGGDAGKGGPGKGGGGNGRGPAAPKKPPGAFGQFMERILEEARKDPTYRKLTDDREGKGKDRKTDRDDRRDRTRPRPKPGRKQSP